jgi:hypothetical protein
MTIYVTKRVDAAWLNEVTEAVIAVDRANGAVGRLSGLIARYASDPADSVDYNDDVADLFNDAGMRHKLAALRNRLQAIRDDLLFCQKSAYAVGHITIDAKQLWAAAVYTEEQARALVDKVVAGK